MREENRSISSALRLFQEAFAPDQRYIVLHVHGARLRLVVIARRKHELGVHRRDPVPRRVCQHVYRTHDSTWDSQCWSGVLRTEDACGSLIAAGVDARESWYRDYAGKIDTAAYPMPKHEIVGHRLGHPEGFNHCDDVCAWVVANAKAAGVRRDRGDLREQHVPVPALEIPELHASVKVYCRGPLGRELRRRRITLHAQVLLQEAVQPTYEDFVVACHLSIHAITRASPLEDRVNDCNSINGRRSSSNFVDDQLESIAGGCLETDSGRVELRRRSTDSTAALDRRSFLNRLAARVNSEPISGGS